MNLSNPNMGLSNVGLTQGEQYTVKELYEAMAIFSANAATVCTSRGCRWNRKRLC